MSEKAAAAAATAAVGEAAGEAAGAAASSPRLQQPQDHVTVRLPAEGAYLSVLRTATAGLAARMDFTLDEIEDLRIAVDEACAMLLKQATPGTSLECDFLLGPDELTISVSVPSVAARPPARDTFAWTVLTALAGSVAAHVGPDDTLTIVLRKSRDDQAPGRIGLSGGADERAGGHGG